MYNRIKRAVQEGDLATLESIEDLELKKENLKEEKERENRVCDPIYFAIDSNQLGLIPYLVEKRKLSSKCALTRALECQYIEVAKYLHGKHFPLSKANHIYSLEVMKLVTEWSYTFDENAYREIISVWNDGKVVDRLQYLFELQPIVITDLKKYYNYVTDDVAAFLISFTDKMLYPDLMNKAAKNHWFTTILGLLELKIEFKVNHLLKLASSTEYELVDKLRSRLGVKLEVLFLDVFRDNNFNANFKHYTAYIDNLYEFGLKYNLMSLACENMDAEVVILLIQAGLIFSFEDADIFINYEAECYAERGYDWRRIKQLLPYCTPEVQEYIMQEIK